MSYDRIRSRRGKLTPLEVRRKAWDDLGGAMSGKNTKMVGKWAFHRPGSQKKH